MAKACIICAKEVPRGKMVQDDWVITAIRAVKRKLGIARNNTLVVCEGCMEEYKKKRSAYEKRLIQHIVIGAVVLIIFILLPLFAGGFSLWSVLLGLLFAAGVLALSAFNHCPKLYDEPQPSHAAAGRKGGKK